MKSNKYLEVCADSVNAALTAQKAGAQRIEFCNSLVEGGITPSYAQLKILRKLLLIKLYVLIRPRGGDFLYNDLEFEIMKSDIRYCGEIGCDGVVIGMLNQDGSVDKERCAELINVAKEYAMGVTFHRAFDRTQDLYRALEDVISLDCERILTSGGYDTAIQGAEVIRRLIELSGNRITIMPGSGITPENAEELIQRTGLKELHGTFRTWYPGKMVYRNQQLKSQEEYGGYTADMKKIRAVLGLLNK